MVTQDLRIKYMMFKNKEHIVSKYNRDNVFLFDIFYYLTYSVSGSG